MSIKTILSVTGVNHREGDLRLAAGLCDQMAAHLSVLVVAIAPPPPAGEFAAMVSDGWIQERQEDQERLRERESSVSAFLSGTGLSADVSTGYPEEAWTDETVGRRARYADITLIGPETLKSERLGPKVVEGSLFFSGRPVLLVPENVQPTLLPKRVMVAWDGRVEAARAVREAMDMIEGAEEVRVVLVDPAEGEDAHGAEPGADVAAYLARHGAKVTVDRLPGADQPVAEVLRRHATDTAAELLVMGAYGHSRFRERIFGGVTRAMVERPSLPILMAR
ncbi:universal stress protein [Aquibium sp. LZ166]|uniref:Universal stress protein n=1 Tax=Aquibium pacificus TaxID=3153579 RepID=A0ABV3SHY6_9HYPH